MEHPTTSAVEARGKVAKVPPGDSRPTYCHGDRPMGRARFGDMEGQTPGAHCAPKRPPSHCLRKAEAN